MTSQEADTLQKTFFEDLGSVVQILEAMDQTLDSMIMVKNLDSRYLFMSRSLRRAIGMTPHEEVVGKTDFDLFPKIVAEGYRQNDLRVFRKGHPLINEVHAGGFIDGMPKWFFSSKFPLRNRSGEIVGLFTTNLPYEKVMGSDDDLNRLLPAINYISKHYPDKIQNATLARACGFSESHFMRLFKDRIKMTPRAYLEQVRMFHAIEAIKHRNESVAAVAIDCGFYDHSSFVKRFKTYTGTTPLHYRRKFQADHQHERPMTLPDLGH